MRRRKKETTTMATPEFVLKHPLTILQVPHALFSPERRRAGRSQHQGQHFPSHRLQSLSCLLAPGNAGITLVLTPCSLKRVRWRGGGGEPGPAVPGNEGIGGFSGTYNCIFVHTAIATYLPNARRFVCLPLHVHHFSPPDATLGAKRKGRQASRCGAPVQAVEQAIAGRRRRLIGL